MRKRLLNMAMIWYRVAIGALLGVILSVIVSVLTDSYYPLFLLVACVVIYKLCIARAMRIMNSLGYRFRNGTFVYTTKWNVYSIRDHGCDMKSESILN